MIHIADRRAYAETPPSAVTPFGFNSARFNAEFEPLTLSAKSQQLLVLSALRNGDRLTPMEALRRFGCFRLGARIYDLKQRGYKIVSEQVKRGGKRVAEYHLP